jgi:hypothetical protein
MPATPLDLTIPTPLITPGATTDPLDNWALDLNGDLADIQTAVNTNITDIANLAAASGVQFRAKDYGVDFSGNVSLAATNLAGLQAVVTAAAANPHGAGTVILDPGIVPIPNGSSWVIDGCHVIGAGGAGDWGGAAASWLGNSPSTLIRHSVQNDAGSVPVVMLQCPHPQADPEAEARGYLFKGVGIQGSMSIATWLGMPNPVPGSPTTYGSITGNHGLWVDNSRAVIEDVYVSGVNGHGIVFRDQVAGSMSNCAVIGCIGDGLHCDDNNTFGTPAGSPLRAITNTSVFRCTFSGCGRDGIRFFSGPAGMFFQGCDCENVQGWGLRMIGTSFRPPSGNVFMAQWIERCAASIRCEDGSGDNTPSLSFLGSAPSGGAYLNRFIVAHGNDPADDGHAGDIFPGGYCNSFEGENDFNANATGSFPSERRQDYRRVYGHAMVRQLYNHTGAVNLDLYPIAGGIAHVVLSGNVTYTFNNPKDGQVFTFLFTNNASYTVTWDARMSWIGGVPPAIRAGANERTCVRFYYDFLTNIFYELSTRSSGPFLGNLTGNVTGNVTGNLTGHADSVQTQGGAKFDEFNSGRPRILDASASGGGGGTGFLYNTSVPKAGSDFMFDFEVNGNPTIYALCDGTMTVPAVIGNLTGNVTGDVSGKSSHVVTTNSAEFKEGSTGQPKVLDNSAAAGGGACGLLVTTNNVLNPGDALFTAQNHGTSVLALTCDGNISIPTTGGGKFTVDAGDSRGSPGNATINKVAGKSAIAAGASSMTLTNSKITSSSIIIVTREATDATSKAIFAGAPGSGSVVISLEANATGNVNFNWWILN